MPSFSKALCITTLSAALMFSHNAIAQDYHEELDDFLSQSFMGISFSQGGENMATKLQSEGYTLYKHEPDRIVLKRKSTKDKSSVNLIIKTNSKGQVYQVTVYDSQFRFKQADEAIKSLMTQCNKFAKTSGDTYRLDAPVEYINGEDVAKNIANGKQYLCGFSKVAQKGDYQDILSILSKIEPEYKYLEDIPPMTKQIINERIEQNAFGMELHYFEGDYFISSEVLDFVLKR